MSSCLAAHRHIVDHSVSRVVKTHTFDILTITLDKQYVRYKSVRASLLIRPELEFITDVGEDLWR